MSSSNRTFRRIVDLLPTPIAVLWVVGIARFRDIELGTSEVLALLAAAFALRLLSNRLRPTRRVVLPANVNPVFVATLGAALLGAVALLFGGAIEALLEWREPRPNTPWWLRTVWHGACAFAASYCRFLARQAAPGAPPPPTTTADPPAPVG